MLVGSGIELGKVNLQSVAGGSDNALDIYLIFNQAYNATLHVKVTDQKGLEMGRSIQAVNVKKGYGGFFTFEFDKRTNIDLDSKILMRKF